MPWEMGIRYKPTWRTAAFLGGAFKWVLDGFRGYSTVIQNISYGVNSPIVWFKLSKMDVLYRIQTIRAEDEFSSIFPHFNELLTHLHRQIGPLNTSSKRFYILSSSKKREYTVLPSLVEGLFKRGGEN